MLQRARYYAPRRSDCTAIHTPIDRARSLQRTSFPLILHYLQISRKFNPIVSHYSIAWKVPVCFSVYSKISAFFISSPHPFIIHPFFAEYYVMDAAKTVRALSIWYIEFDPADCWYIRERFGELLYYKTYSTKRISINILHKAKVIRGRQAGRAGYESLLKPRSRCPVYADRAGRCCLGYDTLLFYGNFVLFLLAHVYPRS